MGRRRVVKNSPFSSLKTGFHSLAGLKLEIHLSFASQVLGLKVPGTTESSHSYVTVRTARFPRIVFVCRRHCASRFIFFCRVVSPNPDFSNLKVITTNGLQAQSGTQASVLDGLLVILFFFGTVCHVV